MVAIAETRSRLDKLSASIDSFRPDERVVQHLRMLGYEMYAFASINRIRISATTTPPGFREFPHLAVVCYYPVLGRFTGGNVNSIDLQEIRDIYIASAYPDEERKLSLITEDIQLGKFHRELLISTVKSVIDEKIEIEEGAMPLIEFALDRRDTTKSKSLWLLLGPNLVLDGTQVIDVPYNRPPHNTITLKQ